MLRLYGAARSRAVRTLWMLGELGLNYDHQDYLPRAPDYGQLRFEIDGQPSATIFDGVAPQVLPSGPVQLGTFPLAAGQRRVSLLLVGKHARSSGYFVGIDKLRLYPAGPID